MLCARFTEVNEFYHENTTNAREKNMWVTHESAIGFATRRCEGVLPDPAAAKQTELQEIRVTLNELTS